jgi:hypothetical protein
MHPAAETAIGRGDDALAPDQIGEAAQSRIAQSNCLTAASIFDSSNSILPLGEVDQRGRIDLFGAFEGPAELI